MVQTHVQLLFLCSLNQHFFVQKSDPRKFIRNNFTQWKGLHKCQGSNPCKWLPKQSGPLQGGTLGVNQEPLGNSVIDREPLQQENMGPCAQPQSPQRPWQSRLFYRLSEKAYIVGCWKGGQLFTLIHMHIQSKCVLLIYEVLLLCPSGCFVGSVAGILQVPGTGSMHRGSLQL